MKVLIDFINAYHPHYASVVEGFDEQAVSDLELYLERPLPRRHREFLLTMGRSAGFSLGDMNVDPSAVTSLVTNRASFPDYLSPFAVDDGTIFSDYYLDLRYPASKSADGSVEDAMVVRISAGVPITDTPLPRAHSLTDMMFTWAFAAVRQAAHREHLTLSWEASGANRDRPSVDRLEDLMSKLGFDILPHTSKCGRLFERLDAAAWTYQRPGEYDFSLMLSAKDRQTLLGIAEPIRDAMPPRGAPPPAEHHH